MTITTVDYAGREVELEYGDDIAQTVDAIEAALSEDGYIQAEQAVALFPGQPTLHTTMREYTALISAGCKLVG